MPTKVIEVQVLVIEVDVLIHVIEAIFQPFDVQDQISTYMIYHWICDGILEHSY